MLTIEEARILAIEKLTEIQSQTTIKLVLLENKTIEFKYGWVFFFHSEEFVKTGNIDFMIAGNGPIVIDKYNGTVDRFGTARETSFYIQKYCESRE